MLTFALSLLIASSSVWAEQAPTSNRIISAGSSITELLIELGARDQLIALDVTSKKYNQDGQ